MQIGLIFVLTENNLREGGRQRDPLEAYLNVDQAKAAYLGDDELLCHTDDGEVFVARISGTHFKNFRSYHATDLGRWIKFRCRALPGDEIHAVWENEQDRVLSLQYVRKYALPEKEHDSPETRRLEREIEEALFAELTLAGIAARRQVRIGCGVIDILTPEAIYEVKALLSRDAMLHGLGQLTIYATEAGAPQPLRLILVGRETREAAVLIPVLAKVGVEVRLWSN